MESMEMRPVESHEAREESEKEEVQKLDEATFEPRSLIEETADYKQAEAIQEKFTAVVDNAVSQAAEDTSGQTSQIHSDTGTQQVLDISHKEMTGTIEAPLPTNVVQAETTGSAMGAVKGPGSQQVEITPINLPRPAEGTGGEAVPLMGTATFDAVKGPGGVEATAEVQSATEEIVAKMTPVQKTLYDQMSPEDQAALIRLAQQSQKINPHELPGSGGGIIY
jgi:hypothetical protein